MASPSALLFSLSRLFLACIIITTLGTGFAAAAPDDSSEQQSARRPAKGTTCCAVLAKWLGSKVAPPTDAAYRASLASYWSAQEQAITPACVLLASSAQDVSTALQILIPLACQFAVRSGGHGALGGIANVEDGVTIDLRRLNSTKVSADKRTVAVGAGQNWGSVYTTLHPHGLAVSGGRSFDVGVGGSTLGNGWGWLTNQAGFACDNVVEYQVVLASGAIVRATNTSSHADMWKALKGGGSNFGVVTEFVFRTHPLGNIWAGGAVHALPPEKLPQLARALYDFTANPRFDPKATLLVGYGFHADVGMLAYVQPAYTAPVVQPPAFNDFYALPGQLYNTTSITTLPAWSAAYNQETPNGLQQITWDMSFVNDQETITELWAILDGSVAQLSGVTGIQWSLALQPIARAMTAASDAAGGNVLGIGQVPPQGLQLGILSATFPLAADYARARAAADRLLADVVAATKRRGTHWPWIEMNHAAWNQDVFASYGPQNHRFLLKTARAYDPLGVFQTLKPGGYKL